MSLDQVISVNCSKEVNCVAGLDLEFVSDFGRNRYLASGAYFGLWRWIDLPL